MGLACVESYNEVEDDDEEEKREKEGGNYKKKKKKKKKKKEIDIRSLVTQHFTQDTPVVHLQDKERTRQEAVAPCAGRLFNSIAFLVEVNLYLETRMRAAETC